MDLRIDSVYSLSCRTPSYSFILPKEKSKQKPSSSLAYVNQVRSLGNRYCLVSLERIKIGDRNHVSFRKWMKSHRHCDSECWDREKVTRKRMAVESISDKRQLRKRKLTADADIPSLQTPGKRQKLEENKIIVKIPNISTKQSNHLDNEMSTEQNTNLYLPLTAKHSTDLSGRINKSVEDVVRKTRSETEKNKSVQLSNQNKTIKVEKPAILKNSESNGKQNFQDTMLVHVKKEPETDETFENICEKLAKARKEDRVTYIEKLRMILDRDENKTSPLSVNHNIKQLSDFSQMSSIDGTKTLAALQMVVVDGQNYIVPTQSVQPNKFTGNIDGNQGNNINNISSENSIEMGNSTSTLGHNASVNYIGKVNNTNDIPIGNVMNLCNTSSNKGSSFGSQTCYTGQASVTQSEKKVKTGQDNTKVVTSPPSQEKYEIHGHLIRNPDGTQYFIPLQKGKIFQNKPEIRLEAVNPETKVNLRATFPPQSTTVVSNTNQPTSQMLTPLAIQKNSMPAIVPHDTLNPNFVRIAPGPMLNQTLVPAPVLELVQSSSPSIVSQSPHTAVMNNVGQHKIMNSQNCLKSNNTTVLNPLNSTGPQVDNSALSNVDTSTPKIVVPLYMNGNVQNVLLNVVPDCTVRNTGPKANTTTSEVNIKSSDSNTASGNLLRSSTVVTQPHDKQNFANPLIPVFVNGGQIQVLQSQAGIGVSSIQNPIMNSGLVLNLNQTPGNVQTNLGQTFIPTLSPNQNVQTNAPILPYSQLVQGQEKRTIGNTQSQQSHIQRDLSQNIRLFQQTDNPLIIQNDKPTDNAGQIQRIQLPVAGKSQGQSNIVVQNQFANSTRIQQNLHVPVSSTSQIGSVMRGSVPSINTSVGQTFVLTNNGIQKLTNNLSYQGSSSPVTYIQASTLNTVPKMNEASPLGVTLSVTKTSANKFVYSPAQLIKSAVESKDYVTQMKGHVVDRTNVNTSVVTTQLTNKQPLQQRTVLISPFCNSTYNSDGTGSINHQDTKMLRNVKKEMVLPKIIPAQGYSKSSASQSTALLQTAIMNSKSMLKPKYQDNKWESINRIGIPRIEKPYDTVYQKSKGSGISSAHPILHRTLQNSTQSNIVNTKRNKRKPQVVVRIDQDETNIDEEESSPDKDFSVFQVQNISTSPTLKNIAPRLDSTIVEKGLRIPDNMLVELQKKQLSVETTIQKLIQNKMVKK